jgi:hypothetical protein
MGKERIKDIVQVLRGASLTDPATNKSVSLRLDDNISWETLSALVGELVGKASYPDQRFRGRLLAVLPVLLDLAREPDSISLPAQNALAALEREVHGLSLTSSNKKIRDSLPEISALLKFGYYLEAKKRLSSIAQTNVDTVVTLDKLLEQITSTIPLKLIATNMEGSTISLMESIKQATKNIKSLDQLYKSTTTNKADLADKIFLQIRMLEQVAQYHPEQQVSHAAISCLEQMREEKDLLPFILSELKNSPALKAKSAPGKLESEKAPTNAPSMKKGGMFLAGKHRIAPSAASPAAAAEPADPAEPLTKNEKNWKPRKLHD